MSESIPPTSNTISPTLVERVKQRFQRPGCAGILPLGQEVIEALEVEARTRFALAKARSWLREYVRRHEEEWGADVAERPGDLIEAMGEPVAFAENPIICKHAKARITCTDCGIDLQPAKLSGKPSSPAETAGKPAPHGIVYDRPGWMCSVCGGWNHLQDRHCTHTHTVVNAAGTAEECVECAGTRILPESSPETPSSAPASNPHDAIQGIVNELRARLIAVPKPGTKPFRPAYPITMCVGGGPHKPGDDAGLMQLPAGLFTNSDACLVQEHVFAVEPLCERAATIIEHLAGLSPETPKSSRDADHCDYPDCLQHNELVVERLRSKLDLIGRLSAHQPVVLAIQLAREALSDDPDSAPETRDEPVAWTVEASHDQSLCPPFLLRQDAVLQAQTQREIHPGITWTIVPLYRARTAERAKARPSP